MLSSIKKFRDTPRQTHHIFKELRKFDQTNNVFTLCVALAIVTQTRDSEADTK